MLTSEGTRRLYISGSHKPTIRRPQGQRNSYQGPKDHTELSGHAPPMSRPQGQRNSVKPFECVSGHAPLTPWWDNFAFSTASGATLHIPPKYYPKTRRNYRDILEVAGSSIHPPETDPYKGRNFYPAIYSMGVASHCPSFSRPQGIRNAILKNDNF